MEKLTKPENLYIRRNRALTAIAAVLFLAAAVLVAVSYTKTMPKDEEKIVIMSVAIYSLAAICLILSALNFRNLFYPFLLIADETGIENLSGFFHFGKVSWQDIESVGNNSKALDVLDALSGDGTVAKICLKDLKAYYKKLPFVKKCLLALSSGEIRINVMCSAIRRKEFMPRLAEMHAYFTSTAETES